MHDQNCIFCKIITGQVPGKYIMQTDHAVVLQDIAPQAPVHYLIIPKKHIVDVACLGSQDAEIMADLLLIPGILARQIGENTAFKFLTNNGFAAGQRVFHLHFHFMSDGQSL